ncbi:unknown [Cryptobacterium sp. CAG:338]|nr:unknown [Cryptobacterium sp. CAG:338]
MAGNQAQLFVAYPLFEGQHIAGHLADAFFFVVAFDLEGVVDVGDLCSNRLFIVYVISNNPHALPVELLRVYAHTVIEVGLVDVEVHHARIRPANLSDIGIAEAAAYLCGTTPVFNLGSSLRVATFDDARDYGMALAGAVEVGNHFAYGSACIASA